MGRNGPRLWLPLGWETKDGWRHVVLDQTPDDKAAVLEGLQLFPAFPACFLWRREPQNGSKGNWFRAQASNSGLDKSCKRTLFLPFSSFGTSSFGPQAEVHFRFQLIKRFRVSAGSSLRGHVRAWRSPKVSTCVCAVFNTVTFRSLSVVVSHHFCHFAELAV